MRGRSFYVMLVASFAVIFILGRCVTTIRVAYAQAGFTPFQAELWIYSYEGAGQRLIQKEITAVSNDGSVATISTLMQMPGKFVRRDVRRVDGIYARVVDDLKLVATTALDSEVVVGLKRREEFATARCLSEDQP